MRPWMLPTAAAVSLLALLVTSIGFVVQLERAAEAERRADELAAEVEELRAELRSLEDELAAGGQQDPLGGLLDGLLGGSGLEDLLGGLLGGDGEGLGWVRRAVGRAPRRGGGGAWRGLPDPRRRDR
jgi:hypothetical protein